MLLNSQTANSEHAFIKDNFSLYTYIQKYKPL